MCHALMDKKYYDKLLNRHKKRFYRAKYDKRAFSKVIKQTDFFLRYAETFDWVILQDLKNKEFVVKKLKVEEGTPNKYVVYPIIKSKLFSCVHASTA